MNAKVDLVPQIQSRDGWVFATSRDVAAHFDKQVKHVHEAIRTIIKHEPATRANFRPFEIKDLTGVSVHHYEMDREGFTLLVMGFTGRKALKFKLAYLAAFNEVMERLQAIEKSTASSTRVEFVGDLAAAARAWADAYESRHDDGLSQLP